MKHEQLEAWKRVRHAGTVNLVVGIISVVMAALLVLLSVFLIAINVDIPSDDGAPMPSAFLGILLLVVMLLFVLPFGIVDIIAGVKMRKPVAKPKGWIIYTVVVGALGAGSIPGILQLIFGVLALANMHMIDDTEPPKQLS